MWWYCKKAEESFSDYKMIYWFVSKFLCNLKKYLQNSCTKGEVKKKNEQKSGI